MFLLEMTVMLLWVAFYIYVFECDCCPIGCFIGISNIFLFPSFSSLFTTAYMNPDACLN